MHRGAWEQAGICETSLAELYAFTLLGTFEDLVPDYGQPASDTRTEESLQKALKSTGSSNSKRREYLVIELELSFFVDC